MRGRSVWRVAVVGWAILAACEVAPSADVPASTPPAAPPVTLPPLDSARAHPAIGSLDGVDENLRRAFVHDPAAFEPLGEPQPGEWLDEFPELGQTVAQFERGSRVVPSEERHTIHIQPIGSFAGVRAPPLTVVADFVERFFGLDVVVLPALSPAALGPVPRRTKGRVRQLLAPGVLAALEPRIARDAYALMGVTMTDIYPAPDWNYVFGLATLDKRLGVQSFARYDPAFYGRAADEVSRALLLTRSLKVMAHELGHMFGFAHCTHYHCVMNGVNSVAQLDDSVLHLCPVCLRKLHLVMGGDPAARYRRLRDFHREHGLNDEARWIEGRLSRLETRAL